MKKQLKMGKKVEMEHAHLFPKNLRKSMAERIAKDHLKEDCIVALKGLNKSIEK